MNKHGYVTASIALEKDDNVYVAVPEDDKRCTIMITIVQNCGIVGFIHIYDDFDLAGLIEKLTLAMKERKLHHTLTAIVEEDNEEQKENSA